jgi:hypothetical protein
MLIFLHFVFMAAVVAILLVATACACTMTFLSAASLLARAARKS